MTNATFTDGLISTISAILEREADKEVINMRIPGELKAVLDLLYKNTGVLQKDTVCFALRRLYEDRQSMADLIDMAREKGARSAKNVLRNAGFSPEKIKLVIGE